MTTKKTEQDQPVAEQQGPGDQAGNEANKARAYAMGVDPASGAVYGGNEAWLMQQAADRERMVAQQVRSGALNVAMAVYQAGGLKMDVDTLLAEAAKVEKYLLHGHPAPVLN